MNLQGHLLSSLLILVSIMGTLLGLLLLDYGMARVFGTLFISIITFLFGVTLPDYDHPKVQAKVFILRWIKLDKITKHRGHWHSIIAASIYAGVLAIIFFLLNVYYWWIPPISGFVGFVSHLIEDDLNRYKLKSKPTRGLKIW